MPSAQSCPLPACGRRGRGVRKVRDGKRNYELFDFLTSEPNAVVTTFHTKAQCQLICQVGSDPPLEPRLATTLGVRTAATRGHTHDCRFAVRGGGEMEGLGRCDGRGTVPDWISRLANIGVATRPLWASGASKRGPTVGKV